VEIARHALILEKWAERALEVREGTRNTAAMVNGLMIAGYLVPLAAMLAALVAAVRTRERRREAEARVRAFRRNGR
jgi:hypothetical protein